MIDKKDQQLASGGLGRRMGGIDNSRVIYTSTFSKIVAPSLRLGWVAASTSICSTARTGSTTPG